MTGGLVETLGIGDRDLVAFVGGGGKSRLALGAGRELADTGHRVTVTTTTKMGTDQLPAWATVCRDAAGVTATLDAGSPAFLLGSIAGSKVIGVAPAVVDAVFASTDATVLVEADGARRRPFKAPGPDEPVIPAATTLVVIVAGIDAVGGPIGVVCHRPERVSALTGRSGSDVLRPEDMAMVLTHSKGGLKGVPPGARTLVALTKVGPTGRADADRVRLLLGERLPVVTIPLV